MDQEFINHTLKAMLITIAEKARVDAQRGESDIGAIFEDDEEAIPDFDETEIIAAISNIDKATATKEGARRLINGLMLAVTIAARVYPA